MGYYIQTRGWLNIDSIGDYYGENFVKLKNILEQAQIDFIKDDTLFDSNNEKLERKWICNNTIIHYGNNGSVFLFFGSELKNYGHPAEAWIKYLLKYYPNAEGRIDFQSEDENEQCKYWLISQGTIIKEDYTDVWCCGYGNSADYVK